MRFLRGLLELQSRIFLLFGEMRPLDRCRALTVPSYASLPKGPSVY